jgi:hypothetical protein
LNFRRHNYRRFRPGQQPDDTADQRQQQEPKDYNPRAVVLPEGGRQFGMRRTKGRDVLGRYWGGGEKRESGGEKPEGCG